LIQFLLIFLERLTRGRFKRRDKVLAWTAGTFVLIMQTFTGRGVVGLVTLMTLNPSTAYTRRSQWLFAIDDVMRRPWFGFQPGAWTRPFWLAPSVDNWWLLIMMRSGIPSLILLALSALFMWIAIARRKDVPPLFDQLRTGWGLMMIAVILGAATVAFFGKLQPLFAFYMGIGGVLATCTLPAAGEPVSREGPSRGPMRYTRFPRNMTDGKASAAKDITPAPGGKPKGRDKVIT
jgi:O-antigen ligase